MRSRSGFFPKGYEDGNPTKRLPTHGEGCYRRCSLESHI